MKQFQEILKVKRDYYGNTEAAIEFAAEEYASQFTSNPGYKGIVNFSDRDWSEDFSLENGNYLNKCIKCNEFFYGYKRRCICKLCKNKIEDVYAEDCKFFDCAQGRDICINENIGGNRCIGVCKYFEKLKLK